MLESWPVSLFVGSVLGFLAGLGVGGGSLLILWLTLVLGWEQGAARSLNLLFFLPAAAVSCFFRWKQGAVKLKDILPAAISGCIAAILFSFLGRRMDTALLKKAFGVLLLATGIREVTYRPKNNPGKP